VDLGWTGKEELEVEVEILDNIAKRQNFVEPLSRVLVVIVLVMARDTGKNVHRNEH
jgi:hypothetical protein